MGKESTISYGLLMYRFRNQAPEVFLAHPGGPFWRSKDAGAWTIPKGGAIATETDPIQSAKREFFEETGVTPAEPFIPLGFVKQKGGKTVHCWAFEARAMPEKFTSITFQIEYPPRSGNMQTWPEIDRWQFFTLDVARGKILPSQAPFLDRLEEYLK